MSLEQWRKRIKQLEGDGHELVLDAIEKCEKEHGICCQNVIDTISLWYTKYAVDGKLNYLEAKRLGRMLELIDDIEYDLDDSTEEEENHLDILLAALLAMYSKEFGISFSLDLLKVSWADDGILYSDRLWNNKNQLLAYIHKDLKQAFARGDSLETIIKQMQKRFNTSTAALKRLIQTEATAYEAGIIKDYLEKMGLEFYQWVTIIDGKQCDDCDAMDGLVFNIQEFERGVTAPPLHSHCRCQIVPIE